MLALTALSFKVCRLQALVRGARLCTHKVVGGMNPQHAVLQRPEIRGLVLAWRPGLNTTDILSPKGRIKQPLERTICICSFSWHF